MELKEFVAETLQQIIDGVEQAQKHAAEKGAYINPPNLMDNGGGNLLLVNQHQPHIARLIAFDVAVTVIEGGQAKSGIGVMAGVFAGGAQAQIESKDMNVSRISFTIPVMLPQQKYP